MPESEDVDVTITPNMLRAAANINPRLRMTLHMIRPPRDDATKAYFVVDMPGPPGPGRHVVLSIPDELWAMLGRREDIVAHLMIPDDE